MENKNCILRLYIAGITTENQQSILDLKSALKEKLDNNFKLEVIDVFEQPELAEGDKIIATPTIVRSVPAPAKKIILDFNDKERLIMGMDLLLQDE